MIYLSQSQRAKMIASRTIMLAAIAVALIPACSNNQQREAAVPEINSNDSGKEQVDALLFPSEGHRLRHACLIKAAHNLFETSTNINTVDNDSVLILSWCDLQDDKAGSCARGGGLAAASSPGDVGAQVSASTPTDLGEVHEYRYESRLVENDANGWRSSVEVLWNTADAENNEPLFYLTFKRLIDGTIDLDNSLLISASPDGFFGTDQVSYRTPANYTLSELLEVVYGSDDKLNAFITRQFNEIENALEMQAINDLTLDDTARNSYLNALHLEFNTRREAASEFIGRWRLLLAEQLQVVC